MAERGRWAATGWVKRGPSYFPTPAHRLPTESRLQMFYIETPATAPPPHPHKPPQAPSRPNRASIPPHLPHTNTTAPAQRTHALNQRHPPPAILRYALHARPPEINKKKRLRAKIPERQLGANRGDIELFTYLL